MVPCHTPYSKPIGSFSVNLYICIIARWQYNNERDSINYFASYALSSILTAITLLSCQHFSDVRITLKNVGGYFTFFFIPTFKNSSTSEGPILKSSCGIPVLLNFRYLNYLFADIFPMLGNRGSEN
jgi:hypothetical protein